MSDLAQLDRIRIVLVSPRNPLNIGAVARAMANFGCTDLAVVAPFAPHWREARSAVGAPELLSHASECATLAEALVGRTLVAGTGTLVHRKPEQPVVSLPEFTRLPAGELQRGGSIALIFGPEKHGLTRTDLSYCHYLVEIPTDRSQPSMNLGQAVAVCLYEICARANRGDREDRLGLSASAQLPLDLPANTQGLERLAGLVEETILTVGYSPPPMREANRRDLRLILRRLAPNERDTRRMLGLFRRILWRLHRSEDTGPPGPPE